MLDQDSDHPFGLPGPGCMDFCRQTSTRATNTFSAAITIFTPALCWRTRNNIVVNLDILMVYLGSLNFKECCQRLHSLQFIWRVCIPESRQSLWPCNTKWYRPENGRAPPIQVDIFLGSSSDVSNTVGEQVFYALPLIIMKSLVSGGSWTVPR